MRSIITSSIVFALVGPAMVPLWFTIWDSWGKFNSFKLPSLDGYMAGAMLFYIFGVIPAFLTGAVSGFLYTRLSIHNKWLVILVSTIVTVVAGYVLSAALVYCFGMLVFSPSFDEPYIMAQLAAGMGAVSSLFCSVLSACVYARSKISMKVD